MSCNAKKDPNGTWRIQYRWTDWTGTKKISQKRGFKTKKEAEELKEYIATLYHVRPRTRLFTGRTKSFFEHEMERGIKLSGVIIVPVTVMQVCLYRWDLARLRLQNG